MHNFCLLKSWNECNTFKMAFSKENKEITFISPLHRGQINCGNAPPGLNRPRKQENRGGGEDLSGTQTTFIMQGTMKFFQFSYCFSRQRIIFQIHCLLDISHFLIEKYGIFQSRAA